MTHGSLFSGIGGFDLAAQWAGIENIFQVEIDTFCQKVLQKNFANTKKYLDIKGFDGKEYRGRVDIISGGFPCQDISIAGINNKRKGLDGKKSSLFWEMLRIIDEVKPKYILYENSDMVVGKTLKIIHHELSKLNYANSGKEITARSLGYPHKRKRYFGFSIANTNGLGRDAVENFYQIIKEKYESKEIQRLRKTNQAEFIRAFSSSLPCETETDFFRAFDGISDKLDSDRITACGNAIVPQIAYLIFEAIKEVELHT